MSQYHYDCGYFDGQNNKPFCIHDKFGNTIENIDYRNGYVEGQKKKIGDQFEKAIQNLIDQTYRNYEAEGSYEPEKHLEGLLEKFLARVENKMNVYRK
jgi:hypothetical protein